MATSIDVDVAQKPLLDRVEKAQLQLRDSASDRQCQWMHLRYGALTRQNTMLPGSHSSSMAMDKLAVVNTQA